MFCFVQPKHTLPYFVCDIMIVIHSNIIFHFLAISLFVKIISLKSIGKILYQRGVIAMGYVHPGSPARSSSIPVTTEPISKMQIENV